MYQESGTKGFVEVPKLLGAAQNFPTELIRIRHVLIRTNDPNNKSE